MKLIVCLDERKGMMFNERRQSRDRILIDNLEKHVGDAVVFMTAYSEPLFLKKQIARRVEADPMSVAGENDFCFIENADPTPYAKKIEEVIIYHWNRHYPADRYFTMDMSAFHLAETEEFAGSSHEKITKEVWVK